MRERVWERLAHVEFRPVVLLAAVVAALAFFQRDALSNYGVTLGRMADTGLVAVGLTPVLILGEIDLSVGSTMALAGVVAAKVSPSPWIGLPCGLAAGVLIGATNALLILKVRASSFIATLGTMIALQGLALAVSGNSPVSFQDTTLVLRSTNTVFGQITPAILLTLSLAALAQLGLSRTRAGRDLYAIGGNRRAAIAANIRTGRRELGAFVTCSMFAAAAGVLDAVTQATADPNVGSSILLTALAAAVLGGAYLEGGRGTAIGTLIATIALTGVSVGLELHGVNASVEDFISGLILLVAVASGRTRVGYLSALSSRASRFGRSAEAARESNGDAVQTPGSQVGLAKGE